MFWLNFEKLVLHCGFDICLIMVVCCIHNLLKKTSTRCFLSDSTINIYKMSLINFTCVIAFQSFRCFYLKKVVCPKHRELNQFYLHAVYHSVLLHCQHIYMFVCDGCCSDWQLSCFTNAHANYY